MEIGWVKGRGQGKSKNKEKGKGKGKSKGKGKDKPKSDKFEGWCNNCGKWGHKAANCWHGKNRCTKYKVKLVWPPRAVHSLGTKEIGLTESVCEDAEMSWIFSWSLMRWRPISSPWTVLTALLTTQGRTCTRVRKVMPPTRLWKHCRHAGEVWIFDQHVARCSARWCRTRWICTAKFSQ